MQQYPTSNTEHLTACRNMAQASADFGRALVTSLQPCLLAFGQNLRELYQWLQAGYERAGHPYGDTEEGFRRWCQEVATEARRQMNGAL